MASTVAWPVTPAIITQINATFTAAAKAGATPTTAVADAYTSILTSGTGLNQADRIWFDTRTLAGSTAETLTLDGSNLTDCYGAAVNFVKVKLLYIENTTTTVGNILQVGNAAANKWNTWAVSADSSVAVGPGGILLLYNPSLAAYGVTAGSVDQLKINNAGAGSTTYNIILIGTSA